MDKKESRLLTYRGKIVPSKNPMRPDHYEVMIKYPIDNDEAEACSGYSSNIMMNDTVYSDNGLECHAWGYDGLGPQLLACNILSCFTCYTTGSDEVRARQYYEKFTTEVIANLPNEWTLTGEEVMLWLKKQRTRDTGKAK